LRRNFRRCVEAVSGCRWRVRLGADQGLGVRFFYYALLLLILRNGITSIFLGNCMPVWGAWTRVDCLRTA